MPPPRSEPVLTYTSKVVSVNNQIVKQVTEGLAVGCRFHRKHIGEAQAVARWQILRSKEMENDFMRRLNVLNDRSVSNGQRGGIPDVRG